MNNSNQEKRTNPSGLMFGSYPAEVVEAAFPDTGLYKVKVRLLGLWADIPPADLPYAEFLLPLGARPNAGHAVPVNAGDLVWVDFPMCGDTRFPRITGGLYAAPNGVSNLPSELFGGEFKPPRTGDEPPHAGFSSGDDIYSRFGLLEQRSQKGNWLIVNKPTGTNIEIMDNGSLIIHSSDALFESAKSNKTESIGGKLTVKVVGNVSLETEGIYSVKAAGGINFESDSAFSVKASNADFKLG